MPTLLEGVLEAAGIGGWDLDIVANRLRWTPVMFRLHELSTVQPSSLEGSLDFYPPEARPIVERAVTAAIETGAPWDIEIPLTTARGRRIRVRSWGNAMREGGRTVRLTGALQDVTARHEQAEWTQRLARVGQEMSNPVIIMDREGRTEWVNKAFADLTGYTTDDLRGRIAGEILQGPDTDPAVAEEIRRGVRDGDGFNVEILNHAKDGRPYWVAIKSTPIHDGSSAVTGFFEVETDVTAQREAEESARREATKREQAEALLRDVLDALPSAVIAYDRHERLVMWNRAAIALLPITGRFAAPGRPLEELVRLAAESGQYPDAGTTLPEREQWIAGQLAAYRRPGDARVVRLPGGRHMQAWEHRSESGNLVCVRTDVTDQMRTEALLRDVLDALPSAVTAFDRDERLILSNRAYAEMLPISARFATPGRRLEEAIRLAADHGQYADLPSEPAEREEWIASNVAIVRAATGIPRTLQLKEGRIVQIRERRSESGNLVSVRTDTTDLVRTEALLRDVLDALPTAVTAFDRDERLILSNRAYSEMLPIASRFALPGRTMEQMMRLATEHGQFLDSGATPAEREAWIAQHLAFQRVPGEVHTLRLPGGRVVQAMGRRSETGNIVNVRIDTTELHRAEAALRIQAEQDSLTLLANRSAFLAALDRALAPAAPGSPPGGALLLIDVDYFKQINDTLGHDIGDALLLAVASRLRGLCRPDDVAARLGGDEFGVLIPGLTDPGSLSARMNVIHDALSAPLDLAGRRLPIGISLGVTTFPADGTEATRLIKNADLALYDAKRNGRGRWSPFHPGQAEALAHHVRMADALREAIASKSLTIALQPQRRLRGEHDGFEALARWHDGTRWVPPAEFIQIAEETGLILPLGRTVMDAAFARLRQLRDMSLRPGRVAVNVTGPQLLDAHFMPETLAALDRHGLRPTDLEMELTETVLLGRAAEGIETQLRAFSDLGITLALDDFGTGYASLASLSRFRIDRLKIDQSFVAGIGLSGPGGVIVRTVISLAHGLEMEVIAEGIETPEQLAFLEAAGCDAGQGYLFARPLLTVAEAADYLHRQDNAATHPPREVAPAPGE